MPGNLPQRFYGPMADEGQVEAAFGEKLRGGPAYTPGRASDQGLSPLLSLNHVSFLHSLYILARERRKVNKSGACKGNEMGI